MSTAEPEPVELDAQVRALGGAGRWDDATALVLRRYGDELALYLIAIARSHDDGNDAFAQFTVDLWRGLPGFRGDASVRTWCYRLARHALARLLRAPARRRHVAMPSQALADLAAEVRSRTATYLQTEIKDRVRALREQLDPDDQTILVLRVDRDLAWRDIARVMADEGDELPEPELVRRAATLRKRFERIKDELRALARAAGLGSDAG